MKRRITMTLGVGIETTGGIVLASDSRATVGNPLIITANNDAAVKIFKPALRVAVALAGDAGMGNMLMHHHIVPALSTLMATNPAADVITIAHSIQQIGRGYYQQNFGAANWLIANGQHVPTPRPDITYLLAGYAQDSTPKLIALSSAAQVNFTPSLMTAGFAAIGVANYALYLLNRLYRRDITLDVAKDLAAYCIEETASQDGKVGGPLRMAIVRPNQETEIVGDGEIARLGHRVQAHREALRTSFLTLRQELPPPLREPAPPGQFDQPGPGPELVPGK
jgi:20S proteasome alpha/beta subunit